MLKYWNGHLVDAVLACYYNAISKLHVKFILALDLRGSQPAVGQLRWFRFSDVPDGRVLGWYSEKEHTFRGVM